MNTRKAYRMIVLLVCLLAVVASMIACDGGDNCYKNSDGILVCNSPDDLMHYVQPDVQEQVKTVIDNTNRDISEGVDTWVDQHNDGTQWMDSKCVSFFGESCE